MADSLLTGWQRAADSSQGSSGLGPVGLAVVNLHFGFLLWINTAFIVVANDLPGIRAAWNRDLFFGLSAYTCCVVVLVALLSLTLFEAFILRANSSQVGYRVIGYGANLTFLAAVGLVLFSLQATLLDDAWFEAAVSNESPEPGRFWVGRIIDDASTGCPRETRACLLVELESGDVVSAVLLQNGDLRRWGGLEFTFLGESEPSAIVNVEEMVGPYSGATFYEASYVSEPFPELYWQSILKDRR